MKPPVAWRVGIKNPARSRVFLSVGAPDYFVEVAVEVEVEVEVEPPPPPPLAAAATPAATAAAIAIWAAVRVPAAAPAAPAPAVPPVPVPLAAPVPVPSVAGVGVFCAKAGVADETASSAAANRAVNCVFMGVTPGGRCVLSFRMISQCSMAVNIPTAFILTILNYCKIGKNARSCFPVLAKRKKALYLWV